MTPTTLLAFFLEKSNAASFRWKRDSTLSLRQKAKADGAFQRTHGEGPGEGGGPPPEAEAGGTHRLEVVGGAEDPEAVLPRRRRLRRGHAVLHLPAVLTNVCMRLVSLAAGTHSCPHPG